MKAEWDSRTWSAPLADPNYRQDVMRRVHKAVNISPSGCWEWTQRRTADGYGMVSIKRRMVRSHQVVLAISLGYIWTTDLQVDHLCRNRACCNPAHLEVVTPKENTARGMAPFVAASRRGMKKECPQGHPFDEINTYIYPSGYRKCRRCRTESYHARKVRRVA